MWIIMENKFFKKEVSKPEIKIDASRLDPEINVKEFLKSLEVLQVPCPWGD